MEKINIFIIALFALLLVVVSGQQGCKRTEESTFNTSALVASFIQDAPPEELVVEETYPIYIEVTNVGGSDIRAGEAYFYLSGIGANLRDLEKNLRNRNLLNKKTEMQEGGSEILHFAEDTKAVSLPAAFDFTMQLDYYYKYSTVMQTSICVGKTSTVCSISGQKIETGDNSAGPIQVTSLREEIRGNKLYVTALIEDKGPANAQVYLPNANTDKLQERDIKEKQKEDKVEVIISTDEGFKCRLQSVVEPYDYLDSLSGMTSLGQIVCQKTLADETHSAPFNIILNYLYKQTIKKDLTILPSL